MNGVRFHITMKTSTDENTRLMVAVMQQQLREVGIALDIRSFEFATFFADVQHGAFQMYGLRWIGGNGIRTFSNTRFPRRSFRQTARNRGSYSIRRWMLSSTKLGVKSIRTCASRCMPKSRASWRTICRTLTSGISITCSCIRAACEISKLNPAGNYDFLRTADWLL